MIHFRALGVIELFGPGGELRSVLAQPKRLALLAWLAIERPRGFQSRDRALALFWPELDATHARRALNRAIYWLRKSLGAGVLVSRGDEAIGLNAEYCWTDVEAFEAATSDGRHEDAVALYRGDLLRGFFVAEADGFERWLEAERQRLRYLAQGAGRALTESEITGGNLVRAAHWARWTLQCSPWDEPSVRRLMSILDAAGDRAGAASVYADFARHLSTELELAPAPETQALIAAVRARSPALQPTAASPDDVRVAIENGAAALAAPIVSAAVTRSREITPVSVLAGSAPIPSALAGETRRSLAAHRPSLVRAGLAVACAAAAVAVAGVASGVIRKPVADPHQVAVHPFENRTGDSELDYVGQLTADAINRSLQATGMRASDRLQDATDSDRVASGILAGVNAGRPEKYVQAGIILRGDYYRTGNVLRFESAVVSTSARTSWRLPPVTGTLDSIELSIAAISDRMAGATAALQDPHFATWLPRASATPPTIAAFNEFARGDAFMRSGRTRDALSCFRRAHALDPTFTWARLENAAGHLNLLDTAGADSIAQSVGAIRERLTPLELAWLDWIIAVIAENWSEANLAAARAADMAPGRFLHLHAETLRWLNRPAEIVRLLRTASRGGLDGEANHAFSKRLADSYHQLGQHLRELDEAARLRRLQPSDMNALWTEIRALAALGRTRQLMARLQLAESLPSQPGLSVGGLSRRAAEELRAHGHTQTARGVLDASIDWYDGLPPEEAARPEHRLEVARALYLRGDLARAERLFRELAIDDPTQLPEYTGSLGVIAARRGDRAAAEAFLSELERERVGTVPPPRYSLFAQARIVARLGDARRAVRLLREALGGQGLDLHMDADFDVLAKDPGFQAFIRPKG